MPSGGVRDLLVKLSLDTSNFTQGQGVLKTGITELKSELKNLEADGNIENQAEKIQGNLSEQIKLVREQIALYESEIAKMNTALSGAEGDSKKESYLVKQLDMAQTHLNNSKTYLADLEAKMNSFKAENFVQMMREFSGFVTALDQSYNRLIGDWAKSTTDSAYEVATAREEASKKMFKVSGADDQWLMETEEQVRRAITDIPVTYEHFMDVMADAMQAGGQAYQDAYDFAAMFTKLEIAAPSIQGSAGVEQFAKYLNLMKATSAEYEALASVVVEMGNNFATSEDKILETANRAASGLYAAGFKAEEGLAMATSALALGMEPAAAASSLEKITGTMAKSADVAVNSYTDLLSKFEEFTGAAKTAHEMQVIFDADSAQRKDFIAAYGIPANELTTMMKNARIAEKYAETMGMTVQEYGKWYQSDAAQAVVDFYAEIGRMSENGGESLLSYLEYLEMTEIRQTRMARNFATNEETTQKALNMAREAKAEGVALEKEYAAMANAEASNIVKRQNATQNALEAMGRTVTAMRQPFADFFAEVKQGFADLPSWVQTGVSGTIEVLGGIGSAISAVGDVSSGIYYTGEVVKMAKSVNWKNIGAGLMTAGKAVGKVALPVAVIVGFMELAQVTADLAANTEAISKGLSNIQISVDQNSKEEALKNIEEVRKAAERLSGAELDEKYAQTSEVVKMGFGTTNMFTTAAAYEMAKAEKELENIYMEYGAILADLERQVLAETDEGSKAIIQGKIKETGAAMNAAVKEAQKKYQKSMNDLVNGALQQQDGTAQQLEAIGKKYNWLKLLMQGASAEGGAKGDKEFVNAYREQLLAMSQETGVSFVNDQRNIDFVAAVKQMYDLLAKDVEAYVAANPEMGNLFSAIFSSGALEDMDLSALEGEMLAAFQALDILQIGAQGAKDWRDIGRLSMAGLGAGVKTSGGEVLSAVESVGTGMINAIKTVLQIHSPSVVMQGIGSNAVQGLANGVLASQNVAVNAIRQVGLAMQVEAVNQATRVAAILSMAGYGTAAINGAAAFSGAGNGGSSTINNIFNIQAGSLAEQQNVTRLSQKIDRLTLKANTGLGLLKQ